MHKELGGTFWSRHIEKLSLQEVHLATAELFSIPCLPEQHSLFKEGGV